MATNNVAIKQEKDAPVPVEVMAADIRAIAAGIRKLSQGPLNEKALVLLIQRACPFVGTYRAKRPTAGHVKAVLKGIESLEKTYLKPSDKKT